jgi:DNA-directed RNA polymerase specialized sigma24 family protein
MNSEIGLVSSNTFVLPKTGQVSVVVSFNGSEKLKVRSASANWNINKTAFDELLYWLDHNPETAGQQYEFIRRKLIQIFTCKGCVFPEELADETFNRVARKLPDIRYHFTGSPVKYFYGVAKKVYLEYLRRSPCLPPPPAVEENSEELLQHLDEALSKLTWEDRKLILDYYGAGEQASINRRKNLAKCMGLQVNALRLRIYRIRMRLKKELTLLTS